MTLGNETHTAPYYLLQVIDNVSSTVQDKSAREILSKTPGQNSNMYWMPYPQSATKETSYKLLIDPEMIGNNGAHIKY